MPDRNISPASRRATHWAPQSYPRQLIRLVGVAVLICGWQIGAPHLGGGVVKIPSFWEVVTEIRSLFGQSTYWDALEVTVERGAAGIAIALLVGVTLGILVAQSRVASAAIEPLLRTLYPVPRIALYPLVGILFGLGFTSQVALVVVECALPLFFMTVGGARQMDRNLLRVVQNAGAGRIRAASVTLRAATPSILAGLRIVAPLTLTLVVAAQMFAGSSDGLGYLISESQASLNITPIFAIAATIGLIGFVADLAVIGLSKTLTSWQAAITA